MRDPIFYRWHAFIDSLFLVHKDKLPEYPIDKLNYPGIKVQYLNLRITRGNARKPPNSLITFWQRSRADLDYGLDFTGGRISAKFLHLQHAPFQYEIGVINSNDTTKYGTCRIYCCPVVNEKGQSLDFEQKRYFMIEMDKFTVECKFEIIYEPNMAKFF
jgi:tyrosinase